MTNQEKLCTLSRAALALEFSRLIAQLNGGESEEVVRKRAMVWDAYFSREYSGEGVLYSADKT